MWEKQIHWNVKKRLALGNWEIIKCFWFSINDIFFSNCFENVNVLSSLKSQKLLFFPKLESRFENNPAPWAYCCFFYKFASIWETSNRCRVFPWTRSQNILRWISLCKRTPWLLKCWKGAAVRMDDVIMTLSYRFVLVIIRIKNF